MEAAQRREWQRLESEARARLEREPGDAVGTWMHGVVLPAFGAGTSYGVSGIGSKGGVTWRARRRVWQRDLDAAKLESPMARLAHATKLEPTILEQGVEVGDAMVGRLLAKAAAVRVPAFPRGTGFGLDGVTYRLAFQDGFTTSRFGWWARPPEGREPLDEVLRELIAVVDRD